MTLECFRIKGRAEFTAVVTGSKHAKPYPYFPSKSHRTQARRDEEHESIAADVIWPSKMALIVLLVKELCPFSANISGRRRSDRERICVRFLRRRPAFRLIRR
jgi:hypothetical protein